MLIFKHAYSVLAFYFERCRLDFMQTVFYSTLCLSNREQIFFRSVLVMYNTRDNATWEQNDTEAKVLVVGKDTNSEQMLSISNNIRVILSFNTEIQKNGCNVFYASTPIKATELIEKIHLAEQALSGLSTESDNVTANIDQVVDISQKVRLLKWPKAEVLQNDKTYPILSTLLSKCAMTLEELAAISAKPEDVCQAFILQIINSGDAEYVTATMIPAKTVERKTAPKKSLLDRIRISLGLSQK